MKSVFKNHLLEVFSDNQEIVIKRLEKTNFNSQIKLTSPVDLEGMQVIYAETDFKNGTSFSKKYRLKFLDSCNIKITTFEDYI